MLRLQLHDLVHDVVLKVLKLVASKNVHGEVIDFEPTSHSHFPERSVPLHGAHAR